MLSLHNFLGCGRKTTEVTTDHFWIGIWPFQTRRAISLKIRLSDQIIDGNRFYDVFGGRVEREIHWEMEASRLEINGFMDT
jgi:hypothetical protein